MCKKTKPARNDMQEGNSYENPNEDYFNQFDDDYWRGMAGGAEKREKRKKPKMKVSGKSVLKIQRIIRNKASGSK